MLIRDLGKNDYKYSLPPVLNTQHYAARVVRRSSTTSSTPEASGAVYQPVTDGLAVIRPRCFTIHSRSHLRGATIKRRHLWTIAVIALWIIVHVIVRSVSPAFAQGPPGPARSLMSLLFRLEWFGHIVVLGIAVTAIRNRVGWWRKPTYGDEGLLSIENAAKLEGGNYEVLPVQWNEVGWIVAGLLIYATVWAWILCG